ncbi:MAG: hypothetical protein Tp138OMZ00d2C19078241_48 [Prokaryotic dsDNA virus sp.]|nr:MAG: hypothetical protein Tp138OMZ00d2C19078241_48 [Prokaryotic dsDNA virus sp.]
MDKREWTTLEQQRLVKMSKSMTVAEAAKELRRTYNSVLSKSHQLGVSFRVASASKKRTIFAEDIAQMMELQSLGLCSSEIGCYVGVHKMGVRSALSKARRGGFDAYPLRGVDKQ